MADGTVKIDTSLDASGFESGLSKLGGIAKTGMKTAMAAIGGASAALGGLGAAAIKVGSGFEAEMSKVEAISGATGEELESLTGKAKEMGAKTKFSASESAQAMEYMAMAGWEAGDMLTGIEGIMNLAAASGEDLALTSDIVTDALTAFGMEAGEAGDFADIMAAASANANTNVSMLGESFKYVAPVAGALTYTAEDTAVALGLMANSGIKASQGGTALRSILSRLAKPTSEVQGAMDDLGISLTDSSGKIKPLNELMEDLRKGFGGLSEAEQAQYATSLAGQEGMSGLLAIVNASEEDIGKLEDAVYGCDGAAEQMAKTMQDNLSGSLTILKSSAEGLGISVYEEVSEPLKEAADTATGYINELAGAFENGGLDGLVSAAGDVFAELVTKAAEQAPKMIDTAVSLMDSFIKGLVKNKSRLLKGAKDIVSALADGLTSFLPKRLQAPIRNAIRDITSSFENGGLGKAVDTVATMFGNLCDVAGGLAKTVLPPVIDILDFLGEHLDLLVPAAMAAYTGFKTFNGIVSATDGITSMIDKVKGLWGLLSAHPIGMVVSAGAALLSGIAALSLSVPDANAELKAFADEMANAAQAEREARAAREEATEAIKSEYGHYEELWQELQENVDQNGKVKEGYEERAAFIVNELSEVTGIEIELNNGVIQSYGDLQGAITDTLEMKKTEARLNAYKGDYEAALRNEKKAQEDYTNAVVEHNAAVEEQARLQAERDALEAQYPNNAKLSREESDAYTEASSRLNQQMIENNETLELTEQNLSDAGLVWQENQQIIQNWETAAGAVETGSEGMQAALIAMENGLLHHGDVNQEALQKQRDDAWNHYQEYKNLVNVEGSGITQDMVNETASMFAMSHAEWLKGTGGTQSDIDYWNSVAVSSLKGSGLPKYAEDQARETVEGFCEEMAAGEGQAADATREVMEGARDSAGEVDFKPVGENAGDGVEEGILSRVGRVVNAAKQLMRDAVNAANKEQEAHSPARKLIQSGRWFGEGAEIGIQNKTPDVAKAGGEMMEAAISAADRQAAMASMKNAMDSGIFRIAGNLSLRVQPFSSGSASVTKTVNQTVNINQPVKSPVEMSREIRKTGRELSFA